MHNLAAPSDFQAHHEMIPECTVTAYTRGPESLPTVAGAAGQEAGAAAPAVQKYDFHNRIGKRQVGRVRGV